jgi:hypothetical protein
MSTQALIMLADALERWVKQQEFEKSTQERVTALASLGMDIDPNDLAELKS